jgi:RHH-type proline utilization regulon transcriptional repressor/proline dehydrogenase/delta 1-pyrroline-5-carboxylate dehydrogenase
LLGSTLALPGPTGERNTLSFTARGKVLCAASSVEVLLKQLAAVLATGNEAIVVARSDNLIPPSLPDAVRAQMQAVDSVDAALASFQIALVEPSLCASLRPVLAARGGALVCVIETGENSDIPLWRMVAERALCVNTTAAGGNASLMTLEN